MPAREAEPSARRQTPRPLTDPYIDRRRISAASASSRSANDEPMHGPIVRKASFAMVSIMSSVTPRLDAVISRPTFARKSLSPADDCSANSVSVIPSPDLPSNRAILA